MEAIGRVLGYTREGILRSCCQLGSDSSVGHLKNWSDFCHMSCLKPLHTLQVRHVRHGLYASSSGMLENANPYQLFLKVWKFVVTRRPQNSLHIKEWFFHHVDIRGRYQKCDCETRKINWQTQFVLKKLLCTIKRCLGIGNLLPGSSTSLVDYRKYYYLQSTRQSSW